MKNLLLVGLFQLFWVSTISAQVWKDLEVKGGLLFAQPTLKGMNTNYETQPETGWQLGITKNVPVYKALKMEVGTGYSSYHLNAKEETDRGHPFERSLSFSYAFLEAGLNIRPKFGRITPYAGSSFRVGGLTDSNLDEHFGLFMGNYKRYDYGLNFRAGLSYSTEPIEPFVEANFYQGLANVGEVNGVQMSSGDGIIKNQLFHQFFAFQAGIKF